MSGSGSGSGSGERGKCRTGGVGEEGRREGGKERRREGEKERREGEARG